MYVWMVITNGKGKDQPRKTGHPARGQLNRENVFFCSRSRLRIWSRETGSAVPSRVSLLISILKLNLVLTYGIPSEFRGGVHLFVAEYMDQPGKIANPARGQLNRKSVFSLPPFALENLVLRDGFGRSVPRHHAHSPHSG